MAACHPAGMAERPSLSTAEAAARLGVKPETVYAYVSRGLIARHLAADGRTSRLDAADVERMARRGRRTASRRSALDVVLTTAITRIDESSLRFRGHDPAELARRYPFEAVARLLWSGRLGEGPMEVAADVAQRAKRVVAALAPDTPLLDRLRVVATVVGAADPYRGDLRPEAVVAVGSRVLAALPAALPRLGPPAAPLELDGRRHADSLAERLWPCLTAKRGRAGSRAGVEHGARPAGRPRAGGVDARRPPGRRRGAPTRPPACTRASGRWTGRSTAAAAGGSTTCSAAAARRRTPPG